MTSNGAETLDIGAYWTVSKTETENYEQLKGENSRLREELEQKNRLLQQLSLKLFRLVKDNTNFIVSDEDTSHSDERSRDLLREKFQELEKQVIFYQQEIVVRDGEIYQLRESYQELTNHSQMLEEVIRELPIIYQRKFAERLAPVQETIERLQGENLQLLKELQKVRHEVRDSLSANSSDLPSLTHHSSGSIPAFADV